MRKENCCDEHKTSCKTNNKKEAKKVPSGVTFEAQCVKLASILVKQFIFLAGYRKVIVKQRFYYHFLLSLSHLLPCSPLVTETLRDPFVEEWLFIGSRVDLLTSLLKWSALNHLLLTQKTASSMCVSAVVQMSHKLDMCCQSMRWTPHIL